MPLVLPDRVLETSTTTGTGTYTLAGAVTGFQSFAAVGNGNTCQYVAYEVDGNGNPSGGWEVGLGTYTASGTTLARTTVYASSNGGAAVNFSAGTKYVGVTRASRGTLVALAPGGTAGTEEVQVYHDGTNALIRTKSGDLYISAAGTEIFFARESDQLPLIMFAAQNAPASTAWGYGGTIVGNNSGAGPTISANRAWQISPSGVYLTADMPIYWASGNTDVGSTIDVAVSRVAARVVGITDGSTGGGTIRSVPLTPAQITSNQNNYAPGVAWLYRLSTDASRDITGLAISQVDGQFVRFCNVGSNNIVLKHQDTNSTAANRFLCGGAADITLAADEQAEGWYDATTSRWRVTKL